MNVKGFIIEDDQGREFVLLFERPFGRLGKIFSLRGWQRRRLIPMQYTEGELRKIIGRVLVTTNDLFRSFPRFIGPISGASSDHATSSRKTPVPVRKKVPSEKRVW